MAWVIAGVVLVNTNALFFVFFFFVLVGRWGGGWGDIA